MAWVKMKNRNGFVLDVPKSVYESMFKGNEAYSLLEEPKPSPKFEKKQEEVVKDEQAQQSGSDETIANRKNTKKAVS